MNNNLTCAGTEIGPFAKPTTQMTTDRPLHVQKIYCEAAHPTENGRNSDLLIFAVIVVILGAAVLCVFLLKERCPKIGNNGKPRHQRRGSFEVEDPENGANLNRWREYEDTTHNSASKGQRRTQRTTEPSRYVYNGQYDENNTVQRTTGCTRYVYNGQYDENKTVQLKIAAHSAASKRPEWTKNPVRNWRSVHGKGSSIEAADAECKRLIEHGSQVSDNDDHKYTDWKCFTPIRDRPEDTVGTDTTALPDDEHIIITGEQRSSQIPDGNSVQSVAQSLTTVEVHIPDPRDVKRGYDDFSEITALKHSDVRVHDDVEMTTLKRLAAPAQHYSVEDECGSTEVTAVNQSPTEEDLVYLETQETQL
ncbi:hypothetical protein DPMN_118975 [Dreissena polymorpha]|uniref:Uncharacterized protein n=2 Tax=Dreissena polymorpha TaxID=45954 RepID=A0A9D4GL37_DREPO|nr:hypothetical protein DPMN_118975 [Dreissena polymorpha]